MKIERMKRIPKKYEPIRDDVLKNIEEYRSKINKDYAFKKITAIFGEDKVSDFKIDRLIEKELHYIDLLEDMVKYEWNDYEFSKCNKAFADTTDYKTRMKNVSFFIQSNCNSTFIHFDFDE